MALTMTKMMAPLAAITAGATLMAAPAQAQYGDVSPVLLVESGPSDNADYRRMIFVRFLSGDRVSASYKAYNRTEFINAPNTTPQSVLSACANGPASTLSEIDAFARDEARAARRGQAPQVVRFCVKNVQGWEAGNRKRYLDPIFDGMPHAASLNKS